MRLQVEALDRAVLSAHIPDGAYMDAAKSGGLAGLELECTLHALRTGAEPHRGTRDIVTLDADPATLQRLGLTILERLGTPALNDSEWRMVIGALRSFHASNTDALADRLEQQQRANGSVE